MIYGGDSYCCCCCSETAFVTKDIHESINVLVIYRWENSNLFSLILILGGKFWLCLYNMLQILTQSTIKPIMPYTHIGATHDWQRSTLEDANICQYWSKANVGEGQKANCAKQKARIAAKSWMFSHRRLWPQNTVDAALIFILLFTTGTWHNN